MEAYILVTYLVVGLIATIVLWNERFKSTVYYLDHGDAKDVKCLFIFFGMIVWPIYLFIYLKEKF